VGLEFKDEAALNEWMRATDAGRRFREAYIANAIFGQLGGKDLRREEDPGPKEVAVDFAPVMLVAVQHADRVDLYGPPGVTVQAFTQCHMETAEGERLAQELVKIDMGLHYAEMLNEGHPSVDYAGKIATLYTEAITPQDRAVRDYEVELLRTLGSVGEKLRGSHAGLDQRGHESQRPEVDSASAEARVRGDAPVAAGNGRSRPEGDAESGQAGGHSQHGQHGVVPSEFGPLEPGNNPYSRRGWSRDADCE